MRIRTLWLSTRFFLLYRITQTSGHSKQPIIKKTGWVWKVGGSSPKTSEWGTRSTGRFCWWNEFVSVSSQDIMNRGTSWRSVEVHGGVDSHPEVWRVHTGFVRWSQHFWSYILAIFHSRHLTLDHLAHVRSLCSASEISKPGTQSQNHQYVVECPAWRRRTPSRELIMFYSCTSFPRRYLLGGEIKGGIDTTGFCSCFLEFYHDYEEAFGPTRMAARYLKVSKKKRRSNVWFPPIRLHPDHIYPRVRDPARESTVTWADHSSQEKRQRKGQRTIDYCAVWDGKKKVASGPFFRASIPVFPG